MKDGILVSTKCREINTLFDHLQLIGASQNDHKILLESADVISKKEEKSLALFDMALKIEANGQQVIIYALLLEGQKLLECLAKDLSKFLLSQTKEKIVLTYPNLGNEVDLLAKMHKPSLLDPLRILLAKLKTNDDAIKPYILLSGAFSYDFLDHFEVLPNAKADILKAPNYIFYLPLTVLSINHVTKKANIYAHALGEKEDEAKKMADQRISSIMKEIKALPKVSPCKPVLGNEKIDYMVDINDQDFNSLVNTCKKHIKLGDVYQIVPSRTFSLSIKDYFGAYEHLRAINPSPYMFLINAKSWTLFGSSPETFVKVDKKNKKVFIRPIAGTRRRGLDAKGIINEEQDSREEASLCLDEKELAEHMMLVDLARNDIASICEDKSKKVSKLLQVDRFSHVMHLVSEVEGTLKEGHDALLVYQSSMNMGTLMGAPKIKAAQLLRKYEASKRGFYGGAVGYLNLAGDLDLAIIIRFAMVKEEKAYVRTGCGVVLDSEPELETIETINKAEAVLRSIIASFAPDYP